MRTDDLYFFLQGWTALGFVALALCFLRFWARSRDRLFAIFALAFAIFAANRIAQVAVDSTDEVELIIYGARALGFVLIAAAILDKNRAERPGRTAEPGGAEPPRPGSPPP